MKPKRIKNILKDCRLIILAEIYFLAEHMGHARLLTGTVPVAL